MEGWDQDVQRNYYLWAIKGKNEIIVLDADTRVTLAPERKLHNFVNPLKVLERIGAKNGNVIGQASGFHHTRSSISKFLFLEMILDP
ncbi:MAG: hypothetical protein ABSF48_14685 [Thermodesulfobacteriota bacterium]|jgi:hypothetical protein